MIRLLNTLSLPRDGGGDGSALFICVSHKFESLFSFDEDVGADTRVVLIFDAGVGLDIISSGSRAGTFASRGESGEGVFRSGEEERGDGTCGE